MFNHNNDPRKNPPGKFSTGLGKASNLIQIVGGTAEIVLGTILIPKGMKAAEKESGE